MKRFSEYTLSDVISYIVLNKKREHVATVKAGYTRSGTCIVESINYANDEPVKVSKAGGYGYDKFTAALSDHTIDSHKMTNHCGESKPVPKRGYWPQNHKAPKGYFLTNGAFFDSQTHKRVEQVRLFDKDNETFLEWRYFELGDAPNEYALSQNPTLNSEFSVPADRVVWGYTSCYRYEGLRYLSAIGYRVIQS